MSLHVNKTVLIPEESSKKFETICQSKLIIYTFCTGGWHLVNESNMGSPFEQCDATVQSEAANNTLLLAYSKVGNISLF